jgi:hypothetical protein
MLKPEETFGCFPPKYLLGIVIEGLLLDETFSE